MLQQINEAAILETWAPIIEEKVGKQDAYKTQWMAKYCHNHTINEGFSWPQASVANVPGMGNVAFPAAPTGPSSFYSGAQGSGDKFPTLLPLAMQVAARTVGFDIVPVIPMAGPAGVLPYIDFVYAGGKLDSTEKPLVIKIAFTASTPLVVGTTYHLESGSGTATSGDKKVTVKYVGKSRIDGSYIFQVIKGTDMTYNGSAWVTAGADAYTLADILDGGATLAIDSAGSPGSLVTSASGITNSASLVNALEDHIQGFSGAGANDTSSWTGPYATGTATQQPMLRGVGETAGYRALGTKVYTKAVDAETFQVSTVVTTEQIQDLNKQFGIDLVSMVQNALVNEISQSINKHILSRAFALGWQNTNEVFATEGLNLNLSLDTAFTTGSRNTPAYINHLGTGVAMSIPYYVGFGTSTVVATENLPTLQRRIYSRVLAAANMITTRGRRGPANFIVTNGALATAIQDVAGFVAAPMANTVNQQNGNLYPVGTISGMQVFVDPNMTWSDNRILVGRKGADEDPGLKFCVYLMAESIQTIAEGTMSPKIAVKSRYALVEAGHHPQTQYCTIHVDMGSNPGLF